MNGCHRWTACMLTVLTVSLFSVKAGRAAEEPGGGSLPEDLAAVGVMYAGEDLHEGGLAGAVFAQQQVHLAALDGQVAVAQGDHASETFSDVLELQQHRGQN